MLGANERRAKLEDLLGRVQRNRSRRADKRTATVQTAVAVPPQPDPIPVAKEPKPVAETPVPVAKEPATAAEVREFASVPTSSGSVAVATGQREREWTLSAVLERAWKLGSAE